MFLTLANFMGTKPLQITGWYVHVRNACPSQFWKVVEKKMGKKARSGPKF